MRRREKRKGFSYDNEPCLQSEKASSEAQGQKNEDNKPIEETKADQAKTNHETDSQASENGIMDKAVSLNAIQGMISKEVTWVAIAAIGGAVIVIWNIIRYSFLLVSSYIMHMITKVPIYLLMMRKNIGFTDGYIFYGTIIVLFLITNPLKYASKKVQRIIENTCNAFITAVLLVLICMMLLEDWFGIDFYSGFFSQNNTQIQLLQAVKYMYTLILPMLLPLLFIDTVIQEDPMVESNKKHRIKQMTWVKYLEKILNKPSECLMKLKEYRLPFWARMWLAFIIAMAWMFLAAQPVEGLLDQDGRFIVADLGDQYIVQPAVYDRDKYTLTIDTSRYYVIDSGKESVEVIVFVSE